MLYGCGAALSGNQKTEKPLFRHLTNRADQGRYSKVIITR